MMRIFLFEKLPILLSSWRRPGSRFAACQDGGKRFLPGCSRTAFFLGLVLLLNACGFQPRGESARPPAAISPIFLSGLAEHHPFVRELRHQLQLGGVNLVTEPNQAATIVHLVRLERKRSVFSVNANNKAVEYEIRRNLRFSVEHPPGHKALDQQELDTSYIVYNPGGELLGRTREEELRTRDAYRELARRLVTRLSKLR